MYVHWQSYYLNFLTPEGDKLLQYVGNYDTNSHSFKYHNARIFIKHRGEKLVTATNTQPHIHVALYSSFVSHSIFTTSNLMLCGTSLRDKPSGKL